MQPSVSVLTPNFNDGKALLERLLQIAHIFPSDWEYLIGDDGSTDGYTEQIEQFCNEHKFFRLIKNQRNCGIAETINRLASSAKGAYIYACSANDTLTSELFTVIPKCIRQANEGVIVTNPAQVQQHSESNMAPLDVDVLLPFCTSPVKFPPPQLASLFRKTRFWIPGHSSFIRRDLFSKYGCFDEELKHHCDWYINHLAALDRGVLYIPNIVICHMILDANSYGNSFSKTENKEVAWKILKKTEELDAPIRKKIYQSGAYSPIIKKILPNLFVRPRYYKYLPGVLIKKLYKVFSYSSM